MTIKNQRFLKKARKGIKTKQLYVEGEKTLKGKGYILKASPKKFSNPVTFGAYGDEVIIFFWSNVPVVIRIENKQIAESFKKHFKSLWRSVKTKEIRS